MNPTSTPGTPRLAFDVRRNLCALGTAAGLTPVILLSYSLIEPVRATLNTVALIVFVF